MGRKFVKGQSGNSKGRPPMPAELREVMKLSPQKLKAMIFKFLHMNRGDLKRTVENAETSLVECTIASIVTMAMAEGDYTRLDFLLNRSIGKVKEEVNVNSNITFKTTFTPDGNLIQQVIDAELETDQDLLTDGKSE